MIKLVFVKMDVLRLAILGVAFMLPIFVYSNSLSQGIASQVQIASELQKNTDTARQAYSKIDGALAELSQSILIEIELVENVKGKRGVGNEEYKQENAKLPEKIAGKFDAALSELISEQRTIEAAFRTNFQLFDKAMRSVRMRQDFWSAMLTDGRGIGNVIFYHLVQTNTIYIFFWKQKLALITCKSMPEKVSVFIRNTPSKCFLDSPQVNPDMTPGKLAEILANVHNFSDESVTVKDLAERSRQILSDQPNLRLELK